MVLGKRGAVGWAVLLSIACLSCPSEGGKIDSASISKLRGLLSPEENKQILGDLELRAWLEHCKGNMDQEIQRLEPKPFHEKQSSEMLNPNAKR
mmetsp:Transcript_25376/g.39795  ORF Transcript_25376/g.39795 Transcript_25376/m.39795 type:complete len:94 (-) Transcript_25376:105-386(-)